ncbi:MAG: HAMP domain-containing histidine kinase, partial [Caulobacteraceae bacterium]|nr:HAMP domain-containing histidine kinase [Caulobacteraceae bacterium]
MRRKPDVSADPSLLAELGHELRTPLAAIIGFADAMRARAFGPLGDSYARSADAIHEAGRHLLALVDDLTDVARIESGRAAPALETFEIDGLVARTVAMFALDAEHAGVRLSASSDGGPLDVIADRAAIRRILINLIGNAMKFTRAGGAVTVTVGVDGVDLLLFFDDDGGREPQAKGDGLGLRLVRALCALHDGSMAM